jgi:iron complex outermembrane recepter protein
MIRSTRFTHRGIAFPRLPISAAVAAVALSSLAGQTLAQDQERRGYSMQLEEVVVTAQKRVESAMTVPISVDSFTAQDLVNTGATDIGQIDDFMPGVEINSNQSTQTSISIRGVESPTISTAQDPSIATFYDNGYLPRAATAIPLVDIERIEVLKGPQGTLFGRNASVGVVNILPNKPVDEFEGYVKTRLGNYDLVRLEGMLNTPITDQLAFRGTLFSHQRDGIIKNKGISKDLKDEEFMFARGAFAYQMSDDTRILLAADYEDRESAPSYSIGVSKYALSDDPFNGSAANDVINRTEEREMWGASVQLEHEFNDAWSMFGIVNYREWDTRNLQDEDGTDDPRRYFDSNNIEDSNIWYSEVRFNYVDGPLNLIVGGNYSEEDVYQNTTIGLLGDSYTQFISTDPTAMAVFGTDVDTSLWDVLGPDGPYELLSGLFGAAVLPPSFSGEYFVENLENTGKFTNWGFFADASYDLTDTVRVAGGLRYSYDEKEFSWQTEEQEIDWPVPLPFLNFIPGDTGAPEDQWYDKFEDKADWDDITGRLVVDWEFMDDAMTYLSYATGYKSGGWDGNQFSSVATGPFDPEDMTSYELGVKGDFFNARLRIEASVFYHELIGKQNQKTTKDSPDDPTASPKIVSSDEETEGFEIVARLSATDNLLFTALTTVREVDKEEDPYFDSQGEPRGGETISESADTDYTLIMDWSPEISRGYLLVHVDYVFNEADDPGDEPIYTQGKWYLKDKKKLNARIAWSNAAETIEVALWGANLLDNEYAGNPGGFVADTLGAYKTEIDDPRTYGIDLRYSF